jgi:hypothetical protein
LPVNVVAVQLPVVVMFWLPKFGLIFVPAIAALAATESLVTDPKVGVAEPNSEIIRV